ncbi:MAG: thioredoxin domain-containing protein [Rhizomicrobium sp.]
MNRNQVLLGIIVLALAALGGFAWYTAQDEGAPPAIANTAAVTDADYEITLGSPDAPIKMIEYAAPMCPICANFDMNEFPRLKAEYIDTGKVFYIFRVSPIGAPDYGAEGIARCLPKSQYLAFIDYLYRNQDKWDPDGHVILDVRASLIAMAATTGMPADKASQCIDDKDTQARTMRIAQEGAARYGITGTPTFIVDGQNVYSGEWHWGDMKAALDAKLAK